MILRNIIITYIFNVKLPQNRFAPIFTNTPQTPQKVQARTGHGLPPNPHPVLPLFLRLTRSPSPVRLFNHLDLLN